MLSRREECLATPSFSYLTNTLILQLLINFVIGKNLQLGALKIFKAGTRLVKPLLVGVLEINTIKGQEV